METTKDSNDTTELTLMEALKDPNVANHIAASNHDDSKSGDANSSQDGGLPETVTVLDAPAGGKVYLVGTAHFSEKSQQDVAEVMNKIMLKHSKGSI